jgi:hypothetical protein
MSWRRGQRRMPGDDQREFLVNWEKPMEQGWSDRTAKKHSGNDVSAIYEKPLRWYADFR